MKELFLIPIMFLSQPVANYVCFILKTLIEVVSEYINPITAVYSAVFAYFGSTNTFSKLVMNVFIVTHD